MSLLAAALVLDAFRVSASWQRVEQYEAEIRRGVALEKEGESLHLKADRLDAEAAQEHGAHRKTIELESEELREKVQLDLAAARRYLSAKP